MWAQLADAYIDAGAAAEARYIAEDLVAREPWERANIERFRRALVLLGDPDPDGLIAERLSGQTPFMSTDLLGREEFPALRPELLNLRERGVGVLLVSIDQPRDRQKAQEMLARYQLLALPAVLIDSPDPDPVLRAVGEPKWDGTLPATFVFDEKGKLRRSFVGRADPAALEAAIRSITR